MELLPNMPESLSPREKWCRKNGVLIEQTAGDQQSLGEFKASGRGKVAYGKTEKEAGDVLAYRLWTQLKIKHWNYSG